MTPGRIGARGGSCLKKLPPAPPRRAPRDPRNPRDPGTPSDRGNADAFAGARSVAAAFSRRPPVPFRSVRAVSARQPASLIPPSAETERPARTASRQGQSRAPATIRRDSTQSQRPPGPSQREPLRIAHALPVRRDRREETKCIDVVSLMPRWPECPGIRLKETEPAFTTARRQATTSRQRFAIRSRACTSS